MHVIYKLHTRDIHVTRGTLRADPFVRLQPHGHLGIGRDDHIVPIARAKVVTRGVGGLVNNLKRVDVILAAAGFGRTRVIGRAVIRARCEPGTL